jgi:hypothetical protein
MKVSRKVGRRSRKHTSSSISRRRLRSKKSYKKNSYRKKNAKTQKGGKRGRSYKRMRVHTHKRGKRFHKGGNPGDSLDFVEKLMYPQSEWAYQEEQNILRKKRQDYATITDPSQFKDQTNGGKLIMHSTHYSSKVSLVTHDPNLNNDPYNYRSPIITLKCQKKTGGFFPAKPQKFSCYISYHYNTQENEIRVYVSFTRENNNDIVFQFIGTPDNVANQLKNLNDLSRVTAKKGPSAQHDGEIYSFNFPNENREMFNAIADVIIYYEDNVSGMVTTTSQKEQLQKKKEQKQQQQQQQQQQPGESSSEDADNDASGSEAAADDREGFELQRIMTPTGVAAALHDPAAGEETAANDD